MTADVRGFPGLGRTRVMGVVNVTPDSFSDGGQHDDTASAVRHGLRLLDEGADLLDVGGESTRPGALRVSEEEERERVLPVVEGLAAVGAVVSVDTMRASVADAALDAGAQIVNDVSGGLADPDMLATVAARGCVYIAMHWRGHSDRMQAQAVYGDVVDEVLAELSGRRMAALKTGIAPDRLLLDPGLGFAKEPSHSWALLGELEQLTSLGPLVVGASRKGFLGSLLADATGAPRPPAERDAATAAVTVLAAQAGAWAVRVHEVRASADAVRVVVAAGRAGSSAARSARR